MPVQLFGAEHWRMGLRGKLVLWTLALTLTPTIICAVWTSTLAQHAMSDRHARAAGELGAVIAAAVVDRVTPQLVDQPGEQLRALTMNPRLAFVQIIDQQGQLCYDHGADEGAWSAYELWRRDTGPGGWSEMGRPIFPTADHDLVIYQLPIWNPPKPLNETTSAVHEARQLQGMVILALRDQHMRAALSQMIGWQLIAAGAVCLAILPAVMLAVRRWVRPLHDLVAATERLSAGVAPTPVAITTRDEVGQLADKFNRMARNLHAARLRLQRANDELEVKVQQRTAQLQNAKQRLEAEMKDKDEFLRAVSHDLNAPLRNIGGMASMLLTKYRENLADDILGKLQRISANVKTQSDLIGDLLELSHMRTRTGKRETIDLQELLEQLRDNFSFDLERRQIQLIVSAPLPEIIAERNRIRQVFQNLIDNAIKYMGQTPTRRITVSCESHETELHFTVADTGPGIAPEDQAKVFQVFQRGRHSGTHQVPGRGVGLAGVKTIVECYGGRVWLQSTPGEGSIFHFTLARAMVDPESSCDASDANATWAAAS